MNIQEALKEIKEHDSERAFRYIYDRTYTRAYRVALYYTGDETEAEDIALEMLANVWNNIYQ